MTQLSRPLPEYDAPPVDEVALGVSFAPVEGLRVPHYGLYWETIRSTYPKCDTQPPIAMQIEPMQASNQVQLQISSDPNFVRCWFLDETGNNLIQVQPDRFLRNWRRQGDTSEPYPRYATLRPAFDREWTNFVAFLANNGFASPKVIQCEVTYINNIYRGMEWETFADLSKVVTFWGSFPSSGFLATPESVGLGLAYAMEKPSDRLRITFQHALRLADAKDMLQVSLVARMKPDSENADDILSCMDKGRDWIVRAFTDLTTSEMHSLWKRRI